MRREVGREFEKGKKCFLSGSGEETLLFRKDVPREKEKKIFSLLSSPLPDPAASPTGSGKRLSSSSPKMTREPEGARRETPATTTTRRRCGRCCSLSTATPPPGSKRKKERPRRSATSLSPASRAPLARLLASLLLRPSPPLSPRGGTGCCRSAVEGAHRVSSPSALSCTRRRRSPPRPRPLPPRRAPLRPRRARRRRRRPARRPLPAPQQQRSWRS
mgnify:CR=1 FL=1